MRLWSIWINKLIIRDGCCWMLVTARNKNSRETNSPSNLNYWRRVRLLATVVRPLGIFSMFVFSACDISPGEAQNKINWSAQQRQHLICRMVFFSSFSCTRLFSNIKSLSESIVTCGLQQQSWISLNWFNKLNFTWNENSRRKYNPKVIVVLMSIILLMKWRPNARSSLSFSVTQTKKWKIKSIRKLPTE